MRRLLLLALLATSLAAFSGPALAAAPVPTAPQPIYPTDRCVAAKLSAAANVCRDLFDTAALQELLPKLPVWDPRLGRARQTLGEAWSNAEATSEAAGVDCRDTTASSDAVFRTLQDGVAGIAAQVRTAADGAKHLVHLRVSRSLRAAGLGCDQLVDADARHLLHRSTDRARVHLERDRRIAGRTLEILLRWSALGKDGVAKVTESVKELARDVVLANIVSPNVSSDFTMIEPAKQVSYQGKTLEPICSRGTPWVYFVRRGTVNKLLVYYQGGGACWDYLTCEIVKTFKQTAGPGDNPALANTGFADLTNPENPFRDWNVVFVPYCTGDIHWGDAAYEHTFTPFPGQPDPHYTPVTIQHKGFVNAQVAEKWAREHFVNPDQIFVTGSSAGAYGAILNSLYLQEGVYPSSDFATLGDAGNGIVPQAFLEKQLSKWGIEKNLPKWIPALAKPVTELDASQLWAASANFYKLHRFANYATAYDGGNGGQVGFYKVMTNPDNVFTWLDWWTVSCDWNQGMKKQVTAAYAGAPANYRYYIGSGSRHTMWGSNKVYTDTTGGVPTIVSWLDAMRGATANWINVETTDPGLLLSGDPRPNPAQPPYTADGRVVCPAPAAQ